MRNELSWLFLLFTPLPWKVHIRGQQPYCDSVKEFIKTALCLMLMKLDNVAWTGTVLLNKGSYSLKSRFLSISRPSNF